MSKRKSRNFRMSKDRNMWQRDLIRLVGKLVNIEQRVGKQVNLYEKVTILNADIRSGDRFLIEEDGGRKRWLIGGFYNILESSENGSCVGLVDYGEKAKVNG